ncbi:MAG: hypothetical protein ACP5NP_00360 [Acetobacteraceae bacterium]
MIGDAQDIANRIRAVLPGSWFSDNSPILDGLIGGIATSWAWLYAALQYVRLQTRIATATDVWLDVIAQDFFGTGISRRSGEGDASLRRRVQLEIFRERATRAGLVQVLVDLTGRPPTVFEPLRPADTGAYGGEGQVGTSLAYGAAGGWGSLDLPFQCFVTAYRPTGSGIASVAGWSTPAGGYGLGAIEYATADMISGQVTDADINQAVASVLPTATTAWLRISS